MSNEIKTHFTLSPAEDECVDDSYILNANPNITIQDARSYGGGFRVNEWLEEEITVDGVTKSRELHEAPLFEVFTMKDVEDGKTDFDIAVEKGKNITNSVRNNLN